MLEFIASIISSVLTLVGVVITVIMTQKRHSNEIEQKLEVHNAVIDEKIDNLTKETEKHNSVIERTYKLEQASAVQAEKITVANKRIEDLEEIVKNEKK